MISLRLVVPVVGLGWLMAAGCDDNRPVVDLPVGGDQAAAGGPGAAGEPTAVGGSGASGAPGASGGDGGGGGVAGVPECPADLFTAEGEDCQTFGEGFTCSDGGTDPCEFGNSIVCTLGVWERREAFPAPCGGAGGGGAGGESGGAGAGGG